MTCRPHRLVSNTALIATLVLMAAATPRAQPPVAHRQITYIMPIFDTVVTAVDAADLRSRIGEGLYVKVGFSAYVGIEMTDWNVDIANPLAVQAALTTTFARIDFLIATAQAAGLPLNLNVVTASRGAYDPVQTASEIEDRRSMQWYSTNEIAPGWWSHSRYARKARGVQEAYVREVGRYIAKKMAELPAVLVSAAGDGEVELSYGHSYPWDDTPFENPIIADYSPFAVAEFRDWLTNSGLYTLPQGSRPGERYAGEGYGLAARYAGDASPGTDSNGDGHTLNGDFGTAFADWNLRYGDWSLADSAGADPNAIPVSAGPVADGGGAHFDAPRRNFNPCGQPNPCPGIPTDAWYQVWALFRQTMLQHHNTDFAKWMTTTPVNPSLPANPATNPTIPPDRWYSYQIPADYVFGNNPQIYNIRFLTSASAWTTADITPYGGLGMTGFNVNLAVPPAVNGPYGKTLATVLPFVKARNPRWAVLEWNPSIPRSPDPKVYRDEMALVEDYRPGLLVPFVWDDHNTNGTVQTKDTPFEYELKALVTRIGNVPVPYTCQFGVTPVAGVVAAGGAGSLGVTASATDCAWIATSNVPWLAITSGAGTGSGAAGYTVAANKAIAQRTGTITVNGVAHTVTQLGGVVLPVSSLITLDTPSTGGTVAQPFAVAGWALNPSAPSGTGVDAIHVYAFPSNGGAPSFLGVASYGAARPDVGAVFGNRFTNAGFNLAAAGPGPGAYQVVAYAHSSATGTFDASASALVTVQAPATRPRAALDTPVERATVGGSFFVGGWALDAAAAGGTGVDAVHVYAFPSGGGSPAFLGVAAYGTTRPDVGSAYGGAFTSSGFGLAATPLAPGAYTLVVYFRSTISGVFSSVAHAITVRPPGDPFMALDTPAASSNVAVPFHVAGWAVDRDAPAGPGVDTVHVWAFPSGGGAALFLGAATYGGTRPDVGQVFGPRFANAGYDLIVTSPPAGQYEIVVFARSTVTGTFNQALAVIVNGGQP